MILATKLSMGNIDDVEAFVQHCINKGRVILTPDEREELLATGLAITAELYNSYDASRDPGAHEKGKGFFGYALYLLPRKLSDAWHRSQPHHVLRTQEDGSRAYEYLTPAKTIDDDVIQLADHRQVDDSVSPAVHKGNYWPPGCLASVIPLMPPNEQHLTCPVLELMEDGMTVREISGRLGLTATHIRSVQGSIASGLTELKRAA